MKRQTLAATAAAVLAAALALPAVAQNVAVVNGKPIPKERLDMLEAQVKQQAERSGRPMPPDMDKQLRENLIAREIFVQEAERRGLEGAPDFRAKVELARQSVLIDELFADYLKNNPVSDADAKAEYDSLIAKQKQSYEQAKEQAKTAASVKEYKAHHILVEKEDDAKAIIAQIKKGAKFEDIAKKKSIDKGSGAQGGDLGWANPSGYVPEFAEALKKLNKGQITDTPVKTQFGWHIIRVDDIRDAKPVEPSPPPTPPKFEDVKAQVVQQLQQQKLAAFQKELHDKAKIE